MTSAPTGSGKTTFLYILCELFRHKWDVSKFMEAHIYSRECGSELEEDFIQTLTSILNDPVITKLKMLQIYHVAFWDQPIHASLGLTLGLLFKTLNWKHFGKGATQNPYFASYFCTYEL
jgi:hypothetical protein